MTNRRMKNYDDSDSCDHEDQEDGEKHIHVIENNSEDDLNFHKCKNNKMIENHPNAHFNFMK
jgi:hypothetical protein